MSLLNAIRLQYSTEAGIGSAIIRWWTDSQWSHVDAVLPDGRLLGARPDYPVRQSDGTMQTGVQIRPAGYAPFSEKLVVEIATDAADAFYAGLRCQLGKPYSWGGVLDFVFDQDGDVIMPGRGWFCDALVLAVAECKGVFPHKLAIPFSRIAPGASLLAFSALPGYSEVPP